MSNVLLHNRDPLKILHECSKLVDDKIIVVDSYYQDLESVGRPIVQFLPNPAPEPGREEWNMWWGFSTGFFESALRILGFPKITKHVFAARCGGYSWPLFRIVASRV